MEEFGAGRTVLVVDDQADFCEAMEMLLATLGFRTKCASDGVEALAILEREPASVILTDLNMPRMDGVELIRRLKSGSVTPPPIVAVTGQANVATETMSKAAARLGAKAVLLKPFSREQIGHTLSFVLEQSQHQLA